MSALVATTVSKLLKVRGRGGSGATGARAGGEFCAQPVAIANISNISRGNLAFISSILRAYPMQFNATAFDCKQSKGRMVAPRLAPSKTLRQAGGMKLWTPCTLSGRGHA